MKTKLHHYSSARSLEIAVKPGHTVICQLWLKGWHEPFSGQTPSWLGTGHRLGSAWLMNIDLPRADILTCQPCGLKASLLRGIFARTKALSMNGRVGE